MGNEELWTILGFVLVGGLTLLGAYIKERIKPSGKSTPPPPPSRLELSESIVRSLEGMRESLADMAEHQRLHRDDLHHVADAIRDSNRKQE